MKNIVLATVAMSFAATVANAGIVSVNEQSRANIIKFCEQGSERHCSGLIGDTVYAVVNGEIIELGTARSFAGKSKDTIKADVTSTIVEKVVVEQIEVVKTETVEKIVEVSKSGDVAKIAELSAQIVQADQLIDALRSDSNVLAGIYDEAARRGVVTPNANDYSSSEQYGKNVAYRIYAKGRADRGEQLLPLLREARADRDEAYALAEELDRDLYIANAELATAKHHLGVASDFIDGAYAEVDSRGIELPDAYTHSSARAYGKTFVQRVHAAGQRRGSATATAYYEPRLEEANAYAEELEYIVTELDADIAAAKAVSTVGTGDNYDTYVVGGSVSEVLAYSFTSTTNTVAGGFGTEQNTVSTRVIYDDTSVDLDVTFDAAYNWFNHGWFINGALQAAVNAAVEVAFEAGYEAGYDAGYQAGYADGFADGVASVQSQL